MAGYRFWLQCSLSVVVALIIAQVGRSQIDVLPATNTGPFSKPGSTGSTYAVPVQSSKPAAASSSCKVYSLAELGDDPKLCKWIAETIPEVIQPANWKQDGVKITYYAPGKVLVINHSAAVHTQVDAFLQDMKKSMPQAKMASSGVMPAQFTEPGTRPAVQVPASQAYPVPYPPATPKHLFHFIIRYEGEGVIDSNVVKFTKALSQEAVKAAQSNSPMPSYAPPPPTSGIGLSNLPSTSAGVVPTTFGPNTEPAARPMPPADPTTPASGTAPLRTLPPSTLPSLPPLVPVPF